LIAKKQNLKRATPRRYLQWKHQTIKSR